MAERRNDAGVACPECGATSAAGSKFCESCGVSLTFRTAEAAEAAEAAATKPRRRRRAPDLDRAEKIQINRTLSDARQKIGYIRWFLWFAAAGYALYGVGLWRTPLGEDLALALWGTAAVLVLGAVLVPRQPFAWTVGLAGFLTLGVALAFLFGGFPILEIIVTIGFWGAVPLMGRASRILREHGDRYSSEHLVRRVGRDVGPSEARQKAAERRRAGRGNRRRTIAMIAGLVVVVAVGGYLLFGLLTTSVTLDRRVETFRTAFADGDFGKVQAMCTLDYRRRSWSKVERVLSREGWHPGGASLGVPAYESRLDRWTEVHFDLPRGVMKTKWVRDGSAWRLDGVRFADLRGR